MVTALFRIKKKGQASRVRRGHVYRHYELLFNFSKQSDICLICQDPGLDQEEYLNLKEATRIKGGELFRFMNKHADFSNLYRLFGGGTLFVEWGSFQTILELSKKKDWLEEQNCVVLAVFHKNRLHYWDAFVEEHEVQEKLKGEVLLSLRKKFFFFNRLKKTIQRKNYAYISSIKKISKKAS